MLLFLGGDQSLIALKRHALCSEIKMTALITGTKSGIYQIDDKVIRAMAQVPRHRYVTHPFQRLAYHNVALPAVGQGYVIPEPFITATMVHLMDLAPTDKVLDIGSGTGYDAAVMARLAGEVHTMTNPPVKGSWPHNLIAHHDNGRLGWPDAAPYDAILVRQSLTAPPPALIRQLKPGGRLIVPIGAPTGPQRLMVYTRQNNGHITKRPTLQVRIAPLFKGIEI